LTARASLDWLVKSNDGGTMRQHFIKLFYLLAFLTTTTLAAPSGGQAADMDLIVKAPAASRSCAEIVLTCENGREYPLCPIAVSAAGEIVTGNLYLGANRPAHVRLVPMGLGYRYAGKGFWVDGVQEKAEINFGPHRRTVACTVLRS
jgi:hypothetical protein